MRLYYADGLALVYQRRHTGKTVAIGVKRYDSAPTIAGTVSEAQA